MSRSPSTLGAQRGAQFDVATALGFPFEAVRDLLGVVRAMYAAAKEGGAGSKELTRIARIGQELGLALDLAGSSHQGASVEAMAWKRVEGAMVEVSDLVNPLTPAAPIVLAARSRLAPPSGAARRKSPPRC